MKKIIALLLAAGLLLVGCSNAQGDTANQSNKNQEQVTEQQNDSEVVNTNSEGVSESKDNEDWSESDSSDEKSQKEESEVAGFKQYRPDVGSTKTFMENGSEAYREEVIAENDQYVQLLITLGANKTVEIYKWTEDEISLVFQEFNPPNADENMLDLTFADDVTDVIVKIDGQADWEMINTLEELDVNGTVYSNVLVVKKEVEEIEGEISTYFRYYAPGKGLIKETVEVSGEDNYTSEVYLSE